MRLTKITAIALNTFRESVRTRVWYGLVIFILLLTAASLVLGRLAIGSESRIIIDMGLSGMTVFGVIYSIYLGLGLVTGEIERRTIDVVLSRPVRRYQFLVGKYLGLLLTLAAGCLFMTIAIDLALLYAQGGFDARQLRIWPAAYLIYLELAIVTSIALMFSSFSSPALSALLTLLVYLIGRWGPDLDQLTRTAGSTAGREIGRLVYHLLPNLANFNTINETARGEAVPLITIGWNSLYAACYVTAVIAASVLIFERRNFK